MPTLVEILRNMPADEPVTPRQLLAALGYPLPASGCVKGRWEAEPSDWKAAPLAPRRPKQTQLKMPKFRRPVPFPEATGPVPPEQMARQFQTVEAEDERIARHRAENAEIRNAMDAMERTEAERAFKQRVWNAMKSVL